MAPPPLSPVPYLAAGRLPEAKVLSATTTGRACLRPRRTRRRAAREAGRPDQWSRRRCRIPNLRRDRSRRTRRRRHGHRPDHNQSRRHRRDPGGDDRCPHRNPNQSQSPYRRLRRPRSPAEGVTADIPAHCLTSRHQPSIRVYSPPPGLNAVTWDLRAARSSLRSQYARVPVDPDELRGLAALTTGWPVAHGAGLVSRIQAARRTHAQQGRMPPSQRLRPTGRARARYAVGRQPRAVRLPPRELRPYRHLPVRHDPH